MTKTQRPAPLVSHTGPRIYVACLASYNNGMLHGVWIEADQDEEHIQEAVNTMLAGSPEPDAEEWAIHGHEGFQGLNINEYASLESVCALARFTNDHGELGVKLYGYYANSLDDAAIAFDHYAGEYTCAADFAERLHDDMGTEIPEAVSHYIDWERLARDMELSGDIITFQTRFDAVHVFWNW